MFLTHSKERMESYSSKKREKILEELRALEFVLNCSQKSIVYTAFHRIYEKAYKCGAQDIGEIIGLSDE